jgi:hypothetical protein
MKNNYALFTLAVTAGLVSAAGYAGGSHDGGIQAPKNVTSTTASSLAFDIVHAKITTDNKIATFQMSVAANAGNSKPTAIGSLAGSEVYSYVWPTSLDSASVGFEANAGILALAVTSHPDFDDTPLYDENSDGNTTNDGDVWHSHWVVLQPNEACGPGALGVVDIAADSQPQLPKTWPGLPILIDSPGWSPTFNAESVEVRVAFDNIASLEEASYDGVTAALRVNQSVHAPLLCVVDVKDVASGDLSLPGKVNK